MSNCGNSSSSSLINFCKKNIGRRPASCRGVKAELYPRTRGEFSAGKAAGRTASLRQRLTGCLKSSQPYGDTMELPARPVRSAPANTKMMKTVSFTPHCQPSHATASTAVMCRDRRDRRDRRETDSERQHTRAYSELPPVKMALASQLNRATSLGPIWGLSRKPTARDPPGLYECNYESLDSCSNGSNDNNDSSKAIQKLESAVKSIDHLIFPPSKGSKPEASCKIQYDCITVLPPVLPPPPPPPLPRTRSFKHYRARTVFPPGQQASSLSSHSEPGRAASAPPISPLTGRRCLYQDR